MTTVTEFRHKAEEAHIMAVEATDPFVSRMHSKIAQHWLALANRESGDLDAPSLVPGSPIADDSPIPSVTPLQPSSGRIAAG